MLDFFAIFTRGGVVVWCINYTEVWLVPTINTLIKSIMLEEKTANKLFHYQDLSLEYRLDNEFELVFVVAYQKILQLSYIDKFLDQIHLQFRDLYKNRLETRNLFHSPFDFRKIFEFCLKDCETTSKSIDFTLKPMRSYDQSEKSKKSIGSMIISRRNDPNFQKKIEKKEVKHVVCNGNSNEMVYENNVNHVIEENTEDLIKKSREKFIEKMAKKGEKIKSPQQKLMVNGKKPTKQPRIWDLSGSSNDIPLLQRKIETNDDFSDAVNVRVNTEIVGCMKGNIEDLMENDLDTDYVEENVHENKKLNSFFTSLKNLVGSKALTEKDLEPVLERFCEHLIAKNVAYEVATKLCDSLSKRLNGKILGTFQTVRNTVKENLHESLLQILSPKKRVDILRDCLEKKSQNRPYVITFCGVNGVGKSTNLAKIAFWLIENNLKVLIAACDTFRAGAVEQLRTHVCYLKALYSKTEDDCIVKLFEQGYGKDAAKVAMQAIKYAYDYKYDVVLIDTAGRMHNKEYLMRDLAKLVKLNDPDLVLFVGEALVGNVAVNQLIKFNEALVDYAADEKNPKSIDGILLTKFDTVDDKVGASISMTYVSGQPIMFVGTGQNYTDLKALNPKVIVNALMK